MGPLSSGLSEFFPWLVNSTEYISILICVIFIIRFIAAGRLPAWWNYSMWLMLLASVLLTCPVQDRIYVENVMPVSVEYGLFESTLFDNQEPMSVTAPNAKPPSRQKWNFQVDMVLLYLWFAGVIVLGTYILLKIFFFGILINKRKILADEKITALLEECKDRMNIRKNIEIVITHRVQTPALFGYFYPRLLMPDGICENFSHKELCYVFMHELGHLKRHDIGVSYLMTLLQIIHWFNPLVWLALYQMRIDQETSCDVSVLSRLKKSQPVEYARAIISFLGRCCHKRHVPSMAYILESKSQVKKRLSMIVNYSGCSVKMTIAAISILVATGFIFFALTGLTKENHNESGWNPASQEIIDSANKTMRESGLIGQEKILADASADKSVISEILYMVLGSNYSCQKQQLDNARNILEKGLLLAPENDEIKRCLINCNAQLAFENKNFIEAGRLFENIYEIDPGSRDMLALSAASYFYAGNMSKAIRVFRQMADLPINGDVIWLETLVKTSAMLGLEDETEYRSQLKDTGIYSDVLSLNDNGIVYTLSEVDDPPKIIKRIDPQYPAEALEQRISGKVVVRFIITKEGLVRDAIVIGANQEGIFERAALKSVSLTMFKPATKNGEAVDAMITTTIEYPVVS